MKTKFLFTTLAIFLSFGLKVNAQSIDWINLSVPSGKLGINFTESGFISPGDCNYGARIYYDGSADMLKIVTKQAGTENVGLCFRRTYPYVGVGNFTNDRHISSPLSVKGVTNNAQVEIGNTTSNNGNYILSYDRVANTYKNLVIRTTADPTMSLLTNGNVGIGTYLPTSKLHIISTIGLGSKYIPTSATFNIENNGFNMIFDGNEVYTNGEMHIGSTQGVINLFKVNSNGPVAGAVRVDVDGKLWAEEIEVKSEVDADYVFEKDYDLRSLKDVETFVKTEKHLPDMPSAEEFSKTGQNLAKMDNLLLRKIEELTLYVIQLKNENEVLKTKIDQL